MHAPATLTTTPAAAPLHWLHVSPDHQILALRPSAGHVHMARNGGLWFVRHVHPRKGLLEIGQTADRDRAQRAAEGYARGISREQDLIGRDAPWRDEPMTETQRARLTALLGEPPLPTLTAGEASDTFQAITAMRALAVAGRN